MALIPRNLTLAPVLRQGPILDEPLVGGRLEEVGHLLSIVRLVAPRGLNQHVEVVPGEATMRALLLLGSRAMAASPSISSREANKPVFPGLHCHTSHDQGQANASGSTRRPYLACRGLRSLAWSRTGPRALESMNSIAESTSPSIPRAFIKICHVRHGPSALDHAPTAARGREAS
jgi:hypothetical protein